MTEKHDDITVVLVNGGSSFAEGEILIGGKLLPCSKFSINIEPMLSEIDREDDRPITYGEHLILHVPMRYVTVQTKLPSEEG
jgi:hypothetical protein